LHCSWCSCSVCDEWGKLNAVAFKIILLSHDDPCVCICGFCDQDCKTIKRLSPSYLMSHMLCPGALQFAQSTVVLYKWDCILNRYISYDFHILNHTFLSLLFFFSRCPQQNCFQYRRGTLFSCPKSDMYSTTSFVDYEVWEKVDITELAWEHREMTGTAMESLPAAARRVNQWVRKRTSKRDFTLLYLSKLQSYFLHRQIEQVPSLPRS